jgi:benzodiazapine receptor
MESPIGDGVIMRRGCLKNLTGLIVSLMIVATVAAFGGQFTPDSWYQEIAKPPWTPPGWIFGPVWTFLYTSMGVAAWLVWRERGKRFSTLPALVVYILQLVLNAVWSWVFFGLHLIGLALLDLSVLWILIALTTILFWKVRPAAGILLFLYVAWVAFAGLLNFSIWILNA